MTKLLKAVAFSQEGLTMENRNNFVLANWGEVCAILVGTKPSPPLDVTDAHKWWQEWWTTGTREKVYRNWVASISQFKRQHAKREALHWDTPARPSQQSAGAAGTGHSTQVCVRVGSCRIARPLCNLLQLPPL
jgi:hypothetical protein